MNMKPQQQQQQQQGGYNQNQGGYNQNQGGYNQNQGGYNQNQGGYNQNQGGYNQNQGGYNQNQGGYNQNQGGYNQNQGGYQQQQHPSANVGMQQQQRNSQQQRPINNNQVNVGIKDDKTQNKNNYNNNNNANNKQGKTNGIYSKFVNEDKSGTIFEDPTVRRKFINKTLWIIAAQFLLSALFCLGAVFNDGYKLFLYNNYWLYIVCWLVAIGCMLVLYCYRAQSRKVPNNYILLGVFTAAESYMISYHCAFTAPGAVLMATGATTFLVVCLTCYATKTKRDITQKANLMFYAGIGLICLVIVGIFYQNYIFHVIIALCFILVFSAYLVFDIQRLQGNKKLAYSIDDYIIAALDIYIDIIVIFKQILWLVGGNC